jgi:outer membrane protein TolC
LIRRSRLRCLVLAGLVPASLGAQTDGRLTLPDALARARAANETPGIAAARLRRSEAIRQEAYATLLPGFTITGTYTRRSREVTREVGGEEITVQAVDALNGQAVLDAPLFDARAFPLVRAATRDLDAQRLESAELLRDLDFDVAEAFFAVLSSERVRDAAARRIQVADATLSDARVRLDAGLAAANDVTRSDLELATARLALTAAESAVRGARLAFAYLVGAGEDSALEPAQLPPPPELPAENLVARARLARRDVAALERRAEALRERARAPSAGIFPTLGLRATERSTNEAGLSGRANDWNVAATLTWSLFDGGARSAQSAQLRAQAAEADLEAAALRRRVDLEVRGALTDLATAAAALEQSQVRSRVAGQNADEVRERFAHGLATALEQADATVAAFEADADAERARLSRTLAELALRRALGAAPLDQITTPTPSIAAAEGSQ